MKRHFASPLAIGLVVTGLVLLLSSSATVSQNQPAETTKSPQRAQHMAPPATPRLCAACIRAHMEFLASDAMRGRGSGTADELLAATYVGSQLRAYGIAPAGDDGGYVQKAVLQQPKLAAPPLLT